MVEDVLSAIPRDRPALLCDPAGRDGPRPSAADGRTVPTVVAALHAGGRLGLEAELARVAWDATAGRVDASPGSMGCYRG